jgi:hypothetical protein
MQLNMFLWCHKPLPVLGRILEERFSVLDSLVVLSSGVNEQSTNICRNVVLIEETKYLDINFLDELDTDGIEFKGERVMYQKFRESWICIVLEFVENLIGTNLVKLNNF